MAEIGLMAQPVWGRKEYPQGSEGTAFGGTGFAVKGAEKQGRTWRGIGSGEGFLRWKLVRMLLSVIQEERGEGGNWSSRSERAKTQTQGSCPETGSAVVRWLHPRAPVFSMQ